MFDESRWGLHRTPGAGTRGWRLPARALRLPALPALPVRGLAPSVLSLRTLPLSRVRASWECAAL